MRPDEKFPLPAYEVYKTSDVDEAREKTSELFCPHLLNPNGSINSFSAWHRHFPLHGMSIDVVAYGQEIRIEPGPLETMYVAQFPMRGRSKVTCGPRSTVTMEGSASVVSPTDPLAMLWSADCVKLILRYDVDALLDNLSTLIVGKPTRRLQFNVHMDIRTGDPEVLWNYVRWAMRTIDKDSALIRRSPSLVAIEQTLMHQLLLFQPNNYSADIEEAGRRPAPSQAVQNVIDLIEAEPQMQVSVADLARGARISPRTLQFGFQRSVGMSPREYRHELRLRGARAELRASDPSSVMTVSQVAHRWGFPNTGRFAADYRQRYDEFPSDTLRRRRGSSA